MPVVAVVEVPVGVMGAEAMRLQNLSIRLPKNLPVRKIHAGAVAEMMAMSGRMWMQSLSPNPSLITPKVRGAGSHVPANLAEALLVNVPAVVNRLVASRAAENPVATERANAHQVERVLVQVGLVEDVVEEALESNLRILTILP